MQNLGASPQFARQNVVHGTPTRRFRSIFFRGNLPRFCRFQGNFNSVTRAKFSAPTAFIFAVDANQSVVHEGLGFSSSRRDSRGFQELQQVDVLGVDGKVRHAELGQRNDGNEVGFTSRMTL